MTKDRELSEDLARIKSELASCEIDGAQVCERVQDTLELATGLKELYDMANDSENEQILRLLGVSYVLSSNNTVVPTYKDAFGLLARIKAAADCLPKAKTIKSHTALDGTALKSSNFFKWRSVQFPEQNSLLGL